MGLAASQVRMLTLTSRKASIERDIMHDSNRKIALSREMNELANEYYDALSAEKLMYLSNAGEYTNLSYQYLMGKPGGIEDIDVKSDYSMLLFETNSGRVVLSSEMYDIINSCGNLSQDANNIYIAVAKLCGDANITPTIDGGIISPNLIKDICAGKYDTFNANDLADAIKNPNYCMWTIDSHIEGYDVENSVPSNIINEVPYSEIHGTVHSIDDDFSLGFENAYENDELLNINSNNNNYATLSDAQNALKNYARGVAVNYYNVNDYSQLTLKQKINVAKVMKHFGIQPSVTDPNSISRSSNLLSRNNYAYIYQTDSTGTNYEAYFDAKLFINALYAAEHLSNEVYDFTENPRNNVYTHYNGLSDDTDSVINIGEWIYEADGNEEWINQYYSTLGQLFKLSEAGNSLVQIAGPDGTDNSQAAITNFVNALMEHSYSNVEDEYAASKLDDLKNDVIDYFCNNKYTESIWEDMTYTYNSGNIPENAPATYSDDVINGFTQLTDDDTDVDRLATYVVDDGPGNYFTYIDASALITCFYAMILGENIGYGYDNNGNFTFLSPISDPETQPEPGYVSASNTTTGAYTPYLNVEKITKLLNNMNASKDEVFASNVTVTHHQTTVVGGAGPNEGKQFTPAGEIESQWIKNFRDLINDVKFYFTIVTACAKFGMTDTYNNNIKDSEYLDKNIQNGIFQLMGFDTKLFSLESAKDTDYYLLTSEFSKMNDPAQQAIITAWYETEKAEINSKETYLDTQIENLSIELNSINSEIESVESLINDAIKKFDWGKG